MNLKRFTGWVAVIVVLFAAACNNDDAVHSSGAYDRIYFDYHLTGDEGDGMVNCLLQFKRGGPAGDAVSVEPATVELDGEAFHSDSASRTGFYYELQKKADAFAGKHQIVFTTPGGKQYKKDFEFYPISLQDELPAQVHRKAFTLHLRNFPPKQRAVRLLLLDTAFESNGFNNMVPVVNGKVKIGEDVLSSVKNGPINLELYLEQTDSLTESTPAGGQFAINYGLRREFELID